MDKVLFETGYSHPACPYGNVREKIDAVLGEASLEARRKVLFENAANLYKLESPDITPPLPAG